MGIIPLVFSQENIRFESEEEILSIEDKIMILEDTDGTLSIQDVLEAETQNKFQKNKDLSFNPITATSSAFWFKFTVSNHSNQDIWFALHKTLLLYLDFYAPDEAGNYTKVIHTGGLRPFESRAYPIMTGFWLPLNKANDKQPKTYYIRLQSHFIPDIILQIDNVIEIATLSSLHLKKSFLDNLSAAFIGLMLIMLLYNSFLFLITKDSIYFYYSGYVLSIMVAVTFLNSYPIIEYLTFYQLQYFLHSHFEIWSYPTLIFSALFCIKHLDLKRNLPQAKKIIEWLSLSQIIIIILNFTGWLPIGYIIVLIQLLPLTLYTTCISVAFYLLFFKNVKQARYYLLGWSFFFLGVILLILSANKLIPFNIYIRNASYIGIALEVWMFSLALGERMKFLQKEIEIAHLSNLALIREQKSDLELTVKERTKQLEEKNLKSMESQELLKKSRHNLKKALGENKRFIEKIEQQNDELHKHNVKFEINEGVLKKSRDKLKKTLDENQVYVKQIEQQKKELELRNTALVVKEEEIRQNFEELRSTQDILERNQRKLKSTLAENQSITKALNKSAIISITDLKGDILEVNDIFCEIAGYTKEELIGENQNIVNSGYHPKEFWKEMWAVIGKGKTWRGEIQNRAKDGSMYWVDAVINPMFNDHEKVYSYLSIRYLITDKKEIEEKIQIQNKEITRKNKKIAKTIQTISNFAQNPKLLSGDWQAVSREAIQAGTKALDIDTCQLWYYNFKETKMYCIAHNSLLSDNPPHTINPEENPLFFQVLISEQLLIINDIENESSLGDEEKAYFLNQGYKAFILFPVILSKNQRGILVAFHREVHIWENEDIVFLKSLNDEFAFAYQAYKREQAMSKIEEQNKEIITINSNLNDSITYAERIQKAFLPRVDNIKRYLPESFIFFKPRDVVSGDFYFFAKRNHKLIIAAVDCTGHGIPGAFMSLIGHNLLEEIVNVNAVTQPDKILSQLRQGIINALNQEETNNHDGMDIAICAIDQYPKELYEKRGIPHLEYAGAGNPLIYFQEHELIQLKPDKIIIGGFNNYLKGTRFTLHRIPLDKPTTFYIFSDGIQDQFGGERKKKFATRRLRALLQEIHQKDMEEQERILSKTIENWQKQSNQPQIDDMLLIGVRV